MDDTMLHDFLDRVVQDLAAGESAVATYLGDLLGLYRAMDGAGPMTAAALAARTATHERYVREWLHNQVAGGYVRHHPDTGTFELPEEHAAVLAREDAPTFLLGVVEIMAAMWSGADRVAHAFRTGDGVEYGEHDPRLARGVGRLFGPLYRESLVADWIPAVTGLHERLTAGARVLDVGCGAGISTVLMAQAYPASTFVGIDLHTEALELARKAAADAGVTERVRFEHRAADRPGDDRVDVACFFDALHDMGDPRRVAAAVADRLVDDGVVMLVEPYAGDDLASNSNPVGRLFYAGSTFLCTPSALAHGREAIGAQAGPAVLTSVLEDAGLTHVRVAAETPFNLIMEARR